MFRVMYNVSSNPHCFVCHISLVPLFVFFPTSSSSSICDAVSHNVPIKYIKVCEIVYLPFGWKLGCFAVLEEYLWVNVFLLAFSEFFADTELLLIFLL